MINLNEDKFNINSSLDIGKYIRRLNEAKVYITILSVIIFMAIKLEYALDIENISVYKYLIATTYGWMQFSIIIGIVFSIRSFTCNLSSSILRAFLTLIKNTILLFLIIMMLPSIFYMNNVEHCILIAIFVLAEIISRLIIRNLRKKKGIVKGD